MRAISRRRANPSRSRDIVFRSTCKSGGQPLLRKEEGNHFWEGRATDRPLPLSPAEAGVDFCERDDFGRERESRKDLGVLRMRRNRL